LIGQQLFSLNTPLRFSITRAVVEKSEIYHGRRLVCVEWENQIQPEIELNDAWKRQIFVSRTCSFFPTSASLHHPFLDRQCCLYSGTVADFFADELARFTIETK
jgi:hypothetical protein